MEVLPSAVDLSSTTEVTVSAEMGASAAAAVAAGKAVAWAGCTTYDSGPAPVHVVDHGLALGMASGLSSSAMRVSRTMMVATRRVMVVGSAAVGKGPGW